MKRTDSFANRVRMTMRRIGGDGRELTTGQIAESLDQLFNSGKRLLYATLGDFCKSGEIEKVRPGVYRYLGKRRRKPNRREAMWRAMKVMKTAGVDDLIEMSGASRYYVQEWLRAMLRQEVLRKNANSTYTLIHNPADMPVDDVKPARLRALRARRKKALEALEQASAAIAAAHAAVTEIETKGA